VVVVLTLLSLTVFVSTARASSQIHVTTTAQGLAADDKCSLQEAIYSANLDNNIAPHPAGQFTTACEAGSGADTIVLLPPGGTFSMTALHDHDAGNHLGATATPIVTSTIVIEGLGAQIVRSSADRFRAFAVADAGNLTLREVHIKGFEVRGGDGSFDGGGGGLGAGGAVYVHGGALTVEQSTFELNGALGGDGGWHTVVGPGSTGGTSAGGGGGGLGGDGGFGDNFSAGGGGGGSRGDGENGGFNGGGGGGGLTDGDGRTGGFPCGGDGGDGLSVAGGDADDGGCPGGGGGGGAEDLFGVFGFDIGGGDGAYGGAGGGGACCDGDGGHGGFGGGGGAAGWAYNLTLDRFDGGTGGNGGFGGGGGAGFGGLVFGGPGEGGTFAGDASGAYGGGGAGLGGAIFAHSANVTVDNSTFAGNYAVRGVAGGPGADNGTDAGGAIFLVAGSLTVRNSTIGGNESTGDGAGIVVYKPTTGDSTALTLRNTIVAGNTGVRACFLRNGPTATGAGNLVATGGPFAAPNAPCPGIAVTADPGLEPLALTFPGRTPTMAIPVTSSAVDAADSAHALQFDQRGVLRPAGAEDIGAYEAVDPAPVTTIAFTTGTPDGSNGWYRTAVGVSITAVDDGTVAQTRCALDPLVVPTSFADLPDAACALTSVGTDGEHTIYAASVDANGNVTPLQSVTFKIDGTAPTLSPTLSSSPAQIGQSGVTASPNATDATSGVATAGCGTVDTSSAGSKTVSCTAIDNAGNTRTIDFAYVVEYRILGFFEPVSVSPVQAGRSVPVKLALGDSDGNRISDAEAEALVAGCRVRFSASGAQTTGPDCMRYDAEEDQFVFNWRLAKQGTGPATIEASITYPGTTARTQQSMQITIGS
jgi:hypothetical protein